jgi:hypothetical protein
MVTATEAVRDGQSKTVGGSVALGVASRGLRSTRDLANFAIGHSLDSLRGTIGVREANASLRGVGETRKLIEMGSKIGDRKGVLDAPGAGACEDPDEVELRELTERMEAVKERQAARGA